MAGASIFLSFHPSDASWATRITPRLTSIAETGSWPLPTGASRDALERRDEALLSALAVVVLVSRASEASDFRREVELLVLRQLHGRGEVLVCGLLLEPLDPDETDQPGADAWSQLPLAGSGEVLSDLSDAEIEGVLDLLAGDLLQAVDRKSVSSSKILDEATREELFEQLYSEYYPTLVAFFGRRRLSPEISRELAQDAMLKVYQGLSGFEQRSKPRTWVRAIAKNVWRNWVRDHRDTLKRGFDEDSLEKAQEEGLQASIEDGAWGDSSRDSEQLAIEAQAMTRIRALIPGLPRRQKECLERWLAGYLYVDIAKDLEVSLQTVRASLHKAKAKILREVTEYRLSPNGPKEGDS